MPGPPSFPLFEKSITNYKDRDGFNMEKLKFVTHCGTHIDSPYHFFKKGKKVDEIPVENLIGEGIILDFRYKKSGDPISEEDLKKYEKKIKNNVIVILYTGFCKKRGFNKEYLFNPIWLDKSGATYLVKKRVRGIGIDHYSLSGATRERSFPTHEIILKNDIWIIEDLYLDTDIINIKDLIIIVMPMLIKDASGSPTRVIAIEFK